MGREHFLVVQQVKFIYVCLFFLFCPITPCLFVIPCFVIHKTKIIALIGAWSCLEPLYPCNNDFFLKFQQNYTEAEIQLCQWVNLGGRTDMYPFYQNVADPQYYYFFHTNNLQKAASQ